jgi:hypothetical protein
MKTLKILGLGFALAVASSAAGAFQEQRAGGAAAPAAAEVSRPADVAKDLGVTADTSVAKPAAGTEVRIPGLGKLGVLPKMDFGLELLYGAADPAKQPEAQQANPGDQDDLTIRGTLKHRW